MLVLKDEPLKPYLRFPSAAERILWNTEKKGCYKYNKFYILLETLENN